jgi:hypothetical protein
MKTADALMVIYYVGVERRAGVHGRLYERNKPAVRAPQGTRVDPTGTATGSGVHYEVAPRPRLTAGAFLLPIGDSLVSPERGPVSDTPKQQTRILSHPWVKESGERTDH